MRAKAKAAGEPTYFTGRPCAAGHICPRETGSHCCVECRLAYRRENKSRLAEKQKLWRQQNKEHRAHYQAAYFAENKAKWRVYESNRRINETSDALSPDLVERLLLLQRGKCACCRQLLGDDFHLDHILPIALGGRNIDSNMQLLRRYCNLEKHAKHPADFMRERGFLI